LSAAKKDAPSIDKSSQVDNNEVMEAIRDVMTPDQAAEYLQVNRETIYRYIREGKLVASRLGRTYRVPRRSLDLLLWATRTRPDVSLREYTPNEITGFLEADRLDEEAQRIAERFAAKHSEP
jgi:excisionase family DNA binding protein